MINLLAALLLTQAVQQENWINWTTYTTGTPGPYVAASLNLPLSATGPLLPEDSGTVSHVYWTESAANYALQSEDLTVSPWSTLGTCPVTADQGPAGYTDLDKVDCSAGPPSARRQSVTKPSGVNTTVCATVAAVTGTVTAIIDVNAISGGATQNNVFCTRSDGQACATSSLVNNNIEEPVGTAPVRICFASQHAVAYTDPLVNFNATGGDPILVGRVSVVNGTTAPDYVATTTGAVTGQLVETTPPSTVVTNFLTYSEDLTQAAWIKSGVSATATNQLTRTTTAADSGVRQNYTTGAGAYTWAVNVKAGTATSAAIGLYSGGWAATWTAQIVSGPGTLSAASGSASVVRVTGLSTSQWTRIAYTATLTATTWSAYLYPETEGAGTNGLTLYAEAMQLEPSATPSTYVPTTTTAVSKPFYTGTTPLAWTMNGTVGQTAANVSPFVPGKPGAGPYSAANSYQGPTTLGEWQGDWSVTVVAKFGDTASVEYIYGKYPSTGTGGWILYKGGSGNIINYVYDGALKGASCPGAHIVGGISVITFGRSGGTNFCRMNGGASGSVSAGAALSASSEPIRIGRYGGAGYATTTTIYEILASTTPYSDALHAARFNAVFGLLPGPVSVTRADPVTYTANGFVWSAPPATMGIGASGAEVWKGSTNQLLQSETISSGTAHVAPWTLNSTTVATVAGAPNGSNWAEITNSGSSGFSYQGVTYGTAQGTVTSSVWMAKASGTGAAGVIARCPVAITTCSCARSDGGSCSTQTSGGVDCVAKVTDLGTTPVRLSASVVCTSTSTGHLIGLVPGDFGVATGTTRFSLAQHEASAYSTPYIATTGTATARASTVSTVPLPALGNRWCVSVTATPGQAWNAGTARNIWSTYQGALANTSKIQIDATTISALVYDSTGADRTIGYAHGFGANTTAHRLTLCNNNGTPGLYVDGVLRGTTSGAGTAIQTATLTPVYLGSQTGSFQFDGSLSGFKVCKGATSYAGCR